MFYGRGIHYSLLTRRRTTESMLWNISKCFIQTVNGACRLIPVSGGDNFTVCVCLLLYKNSTIHGYNIFNDGGYKIKVGDYIFNIFNMGRLYI